MNPTAKPSVTKTSFFITFFAFVGSVGLYVLLCFLMASHRQPRPPQSSEAAHLIIQIVSLMSVFVAGGWLHWRTTAQLSDSSPSAPRLMPLDKFQEQSIIGLSIGQVCTIGGLFLFFDGAPPTIILPFAALTLALYLIFYLPRAIKYWEMWERQHKH